mmetsp:Transcript_18516/g.53173  ORF Transcript_18516/g.53173 Transcript_18516/m.53173 type:complete len:275 (+) Transcript_18516:103-927(+)
MKPAARYPTGMPMPKKMDSASRRLWRAETPATVRTLVHHETCCFSLRESTQMSRMSSSSLARALPCWFSRSSSLSSGVSFVATLVPSSSSSPPFSEPVLRKTLSSVVRSTVVLVQPSSCSAVRRLANCGSVPCGRDQWCSTSSALVREMGCSNWNSAELTDLVTVALIDVALLLATWYESVYPAPNLCLRKSELPQATSLPRLRIPMRSESTSASSIKWVMRMMLRPFLASLIISQTTRRLTGSMPAVGSSRKIISGLPSMAMAMLTLRFMPPE